VNDLPPPRFYGGAAPDLAGIMVEEATACIRTLQWIGSSDGSVAQHSLSMFLKN